MPLLNITQVRALAAPDVLLDSDNMFVPTSAENFPSDAEDTYIVRARNMLGRWQGFAEGRFVCTECGYPHFNDGCGELCGPCEDDDIRRCDMYL